MFDYKKNMPGTDLKSQIAFLKENGVVDPERVANEYVVISNQVFCFKSCLENEYAEHYSKLPFTKIKGFSVFGNRTTYFFIVMEKRWWWLVDMHDGDFNRYAKEQ